MMDEGNPFSNFGTTNAAAAAAERLDPTLQRKHTAMLERLSNLHQSRLAQKTSDSNTKPNSESVETFLSRFSQSKLSIESDLSRIHQTLDPHSNSSLKLELETVSISISDLEKLVAENSYFLPSYEVRSCLKVLSDLKQNLERVTNDVFPKKKFSFRKKSTKSVQTLADVTSHDTPEVTHNGESREAGTRLSDSPGLRDLENEILMKEFEESGSVNGEYTLSNLKGCEVKLKGSLSALFVNKLRDCKVYVGPVLGSVFIEEVEGCVFAMASHQIRIHHAKMCDFYLRVRSRPIIEDSRRVRFAPYCVRYDGIDRDLEEANLFEESGNWKHVDDFKWLKAVQSPNWSVLPESERVGMVNISLSE